MLRHLVAALSLCLALSFNASAFEVTFPQAVNRVGTQLGYDC